LQTAQIMEAVKNARQAKRPPWSAARLADEMTGVGVPWNRTIVANLEGGRRKSLRVHEVIALAWVLDVDSPLDLIVPELRKDPAYPVTPGTLLNRAAVRAWFRGETGPLREWLDAPRDGEQELAGVLANIAPEDIPPEIREQLLRLARSAQPGRPPARQEQGSDGAG
jgi:hypothetical protein